MTKELPVKFRDFSMDEEVVVAIKLIQNGLFELKRIDGQDDFLHLPMLLLSNGFERLMKLILCGVAHKNTGSYPSKNEIKTMGHKLDRLFKKVKEKCFPETYLNDFYFARQDKELLDDPILIELIELLADFASTDRYYDMDCIGGENKIENGDRKLHPEDKWGKLENKLIEEQHPEWFEEYGIPFNNVTEKVSLELVKIIEKFARALCRMFRSKNAGHRLYLNSPEVNCFTQLNDKDLGKLKYIKK